MKEAHSVVKPQSNKEDEENGSNGNFQESIPKKQIYSCRSCERKFQDHQEFVHHQQFEHFECDNCYKYFSMVSLAYLFLSFCKKNDLNLLQRKPQTNL